MGLNLSALCLTDQTIDFLNSNFHWTTNTPTSNGFFAIDSIFFYHHHATDVITSYVMAAEVPAGRMYSKRGVLLKDPPYLFRIIASDEDYVIHRYPLDPSSNANSTTSNHPHSYAFQALSCNLKYLQCEVTDPISLHSSRPPVLSANIRLQLVTHNATLTVDAPLRHWNYLEANLNWQIESGPILWPAHPLDFINEPTTINLTSVWLHANQANRATLSGREFATQEVDVNLSLLLFK